MKFKIDKIDKDATYQIYDGARMPFYGIRRKVLGNWAEKWAEKQRKGYKVERKKKK